MSETGTDIADYQQLGNTAMGAAGFVAGNYGGKPPEQVTAAYQQAMTVPRLLWAETRQVGVVVTDEPVIDLSAEAALERRFARLDFTVEPEVVQAPIPRMQDIAR